MKNRLLSLSFVLMTVAGVCGAQEAAAQDKAVVENAEVALANGDWLTAAKNYKQLAESNPDNPLFHSQLGYCYLQMSKKKLAIPELQKAESLYTDKQKRKKVVAQTNQLYLGSAYRQSDSIDKALTVLKALQEVAKGKDLKKKVQNEIDLCNYCKSLKQTPKDVTVLNLGAFVNSESIEHTPIVNNSELYFTSRRKLEGHEEAEDGQYDENIYKSTIVDSTGTWSKPEALDAVINNDIHCAVVAMSADGNELYMYRDDNNGTILVSKKEGDSWSEPVALNENINTDFRETGACLSKDGNTLYFASARPGGFGGLDIYASTRENGGDWGVAENLGPAINTDADEEGPFIFEDDTKLYFSSKGHKGLGGYDIFWSEKGQDNNWKEAENAGYPINSSDDDVFVFLDKSGKTYFSSDRWGQGEADLFVLGDKDLMKTEVTVLTGMVEDCTKPMPESVITVVDNSTGETTEVKPDADGKFEIITNRAHNYTLTAKTNENIVFTDIFDVSIKAQDKEDYKTIKLDPGVECPQEEIAAVNPNMGPDGVIYDVVIEIHDIYFKFAKADKLAQNEDLNKLADFLKQNKNAKIQVAGYCDAVGSASLNYNLAKRRAMTAYNYLAQKGVKVNQLKVVSFGEENPQTYNKIEGKFNEDSKQYNRRLDFSVIQQGDQTLLIRPLNSIPDRYKNPDYKANGYTKAKGMPETNN